MNHIQISITSGAEEQDLLIAQLTFYDAVGFEQLENALLVYFEEDRFHSYEVNKILHGQSFQITSIGEKNWNEAWEKDFVPVVVPGFCAVRAHFHQPVQGIPYEIIITPKMSFGTGHHATTYMMLEQMKAMEWKGLSVFDFGTGTGILAILAEKMGAASVTAIDVDTWSMNNAQENLGANTCSRIELFQSDTVPQNKKFDIILANINKHVILEQLPALKAVCDGNGSLLLSGLLIEDEAQVVAAASRLNLVLLKKCEKKNWISLLMVNRNQDAV